MRALRRSELVSARFDATWRSGIELVRALYSSDQLAKAKQCAR